LAQQKQQDLSLRAQLDALQVEDENVPIDLGMSNASGSGAGDLFLKRVNDGYTLVSDISTSAFDA